MAIGEGVLSRGGLVVERGFVGGFVCHRIMIRYRDFWPKGSVADFETDCV